MGPMWEEYLIIDRAKLARAGAHSDIGNAARHRRGRPILG